MSPPGSLPSARDVALVDESGAVPGVSGPPARISFGLDEPQPAPQRPGPGMAGMGSPAPAQAPRTPQGNPLLARYSPQQISLIQAMGYEKGIPYLMEAMNKPPNMKQDAGGFWPYPRSEERRVGKEG